MSIFVYGDESGVFDAAHHDAFVFGGLVFLNKEARDAEYRRFIAAERKLAPLYGATDRNFELKACRLKNKHKAGLFRSTNHCIRYAFVVDQRNVNENIFSSKKSKQRYLDYVYKVGLKRVFGRLIQAGKLKPSKTLFRVRPLHSIRRAHHSNRWPVRASRGHRAGVQVRDAQL